MIPDFHLVSIDLLVPEDNDWVPVDARDCDVWARVNVGDHRGGEFYRVHLCSRLAMRRIADQRHCFKFDEFCGVQDIVGQLNAFIEECVGYDAADPHYLLARHWLRERNESG